MQNREALPAFIYIIFGILCIVFRSGILSFASICVGAAFILLGIIFLVNREVYIGAASIVIGVAVVLTGWLLVSVLLYIFAVILILLGIKGLIDFSRHRAVNDSFLRPEGLRPILLIAAGVIFLFNQAGALDLIFIISGIMMILAGIFALAAGK